MDRRMCEAAVQGSVNSLNNLLHEDARALDRFTAGCYSETPFTPLHIASMLGHVEFVEETVRLKPDLAGRDLNYKKSSPLHLATARGFLDIVKILLSVDPEMCFVPDQDGKNPLHIASIKGHVSVLRELVQVRPHAARSLTDRGETILHLCVRHNQMNPLKFLLEAIYDREFVNSKDADGNNILHLAVIGKQVEAVEILTTSGKIDVNALNANGITAIDILTQSTRDAEYQAIEETLRLAGVFSARDNQLAPQDLGNAQTANSRINMLHPEAKGSERKDWLKEKRSALMVVASILATMAFQAGLTPPKVPDDGNKNNLIFGTSLKNWYDTFIIWNTISFGASLSTMLLLISGLKCFGRRFFTAIFSLTMWVAILSMGATYQSLLILNIYKTDYQHTVLYATIEQTIIFVALFIILIPGHVVRFIWRIIRCLTKRLRRSSSTNGHGQRPGV